MSSVSRDNGLWKEVEKRRTRMGLKYAGLGAERHSLLSRTLSVGSFLRCVLLLCLVHIDGVVAHRDWVLWTQRSEDGNADYQTSSAGARSARDWR